MRQEVKREPRRYDNRNRQEQARQTRRRVIEAARRLFVRDGYDATTIQALADEAGVAVQTVYAAFGSKVEVLKQLFDTSVVGDDEASRLTDRPEWQAWASEREGARMVERFAEVNRQVADRTAEVAGVLAAAAGSHPAIARVWEQAEAARYADQRRLADQLAQLGLLREALPPERAADVVWMLAGPGPYLDLVRRRGWTPREYEQWLAHQLRGALLDDATPGRAAPPTSSRAARDTEEER
jgi:TetR/AcrR family transcriptional regulator, regulator of autoinduction and epiphytic fitness